MPRGAHRGPVAGVGYPGTVTVNPLVAAPADHTSPFSGTFLLQDGDELVSAIRSGDWVSGGMAAFSAAADTAAAVSDPLGSLIAAGLGWLMDHLQPLKGWLDDLTGNASEVAAFAQTWSNVQKQLDDSGHELTRIMGDIDGLAGEAIDAYRRFQDDTATHLTAAGSWAGALSTGLSVASTLVQAVHDMVRDAIAQLVGSAISWASEAVFSLGLATPWIIEQVCTRVASLASRVGRFVTHLVQSVKALKVLFSRLEPLLKRAQELFARLPRGGKADAAPSATDARPYLDAKSRPSFRKGVVEEVWENAKGPDGLVRDPNTGEVIHWTPGTPRKGVWDMGHIPEQRYHDVWESYVRGELSPQEFRDWYNDPDNYRPELPSTNRSHRYE